MWCKVSHFVKICMLRLRASDLGIGEMHFCEWKVLYFDRNFTEVCSYESNWQYPSIGLDNGLVPNRQQAIIWTNAELIYWHKKVALGGDELIYSIRSKETQTPYLWIPLPKPNN